MTGTVNTLVSDHPWCRTKWSLMLRGGHLREKNKKLSSNRSDLNVITSNYYLTSKNSGKQTTANNVSNRMALRTVENLYITSFINDSIQFYLWIVLQPFLLVNCYNLRAHLVSAFWNWTFVILSNGLLTVVRDHAGWSLTKSQFAVTKLAVLGFQRKKSPFSCPMKGLLRAIVR